jgi:CRP-like cAMP-binding protein
MKDLLKKHIMKYGQMGPEEIQTIVDEILVESYDKGKILIEQGSVSDKCYFVLKGLVRQYGINMDGEEVTYNFYSEEDAIVLFNQSNMGLPSLYTLECVEDCVLVVGDLESEEKAYEKHEDLQDVTMKMVEAMMGDLQDYHHRFMSSSPEQRYLNLLDERPDLIDRAPQHQIASYLGIKPESLSRIKRRIQKSKLKVVD